VSDLVIFCVGAFIFAITVYGTLMAGGIKLSRRELAENPRLLDLVSQDELDKRVPLNVEY
jgi:hypothetical protein